MVKSQDFYHPNFYESSSFGLVFEQCVLEFSQTQMQ